MCREAARSALRAGLALENMARVAEWAEARRLIPGGVAGRATQGKVARGGFGGLGIGHEALSKNDPGF
jgi:hypothetical protein